MNISKGNKSRNEVFVCDAGEHRDPLQREQEIYEIPIGFTKKKKTTQSQISTNEKLNFERDDCLCFRFPLAMWTKKKKKL